MEWLERDRIYEKAGFAGRYGFGLRPVVVIIDFQYSHTDPASPIGSENLAPAIEATNRLLAAAREKGIAIVYVNTMYRADGRDCGLVGLKNPVAGTDSFERHPRRGSSAGFRTASSSVDAYLDAAFQQQTARIGSGAAPTRSGGTTGPTA